MLQLLVEAADSIKAIQELLQNEIKCYIFNNELNYIRYMNRKIEKVYCTYKGSQIIVFVMANKDLDYIKEYE